MEQFKKEIQEYNIQKALSLEIVGKQDDNLIKTQIDEVVDVLNKSFLDGLISEEAVELDFKNLDQVVEKARSTKYYKREGSPGNYKYYYTKEEYDKAKTEGRDSFRPGGFDGLKVGMKLKLPTPDGKNKIVTVTAIEGKKITLTDRKGKTSTVWNVGKIDEPKKDTGDSGKSKYSKDDIRYKKEQAEIGRKNAEKEYALPGSQAYEEHHGNRERNLWIEKEATKLAKDYPNKSNDQLLRMAGKKYEKMQAEKKSHQDYLDQFKPGTKVTSKVYIDQGKQGTVVSVDSEKLSALIDFGDKKENRELHRLKVIESAKQTTTEKDRLPLSLAKYFEKFPDNPSGWKEATDELRDIAHMARTAYNEIQLDVLEDDPKAMQSMNWRDLKNPTEWNRKGKKFIRDAYSKMDEKTRKYFIDSVTKRFGLK